MFESDINNYFDQSNEDMSFRSSYGKDELDFSDCSTYHFVFPSKEVVTNNDLSYWVMNNSQKTCSVQAENNIHWSTTDDLSQDDWGISFVGGEPDLNSLSEFISRQLDDKGADFMVEKCLDLEYEEDYKPKIRSMVRKTPYQVKMLRNAFKACSEWSKDYEEILGQQLGLSQEQVHKWNFDERKRIQKRSRKQK